jgi:hypothetical protein
MSAPAPAAFPVTEGTPLRAFLASALAAGATPEDADVTFALCADGGATELARGAWSLRDLVAERADATAEVVRLEPVGPLAPSADGAAAAELIISVKGFRAAAAVAGR